ncbi:reverse transcriptase domain-containing protein, partial [Tanacetum coccineum]
MDETLYYAWERYNDLLFKCPHHDLNCQQKVHIFYTRLDIPTRRMLDSKGFIPLMTPTQSLISIQVMAERSHNWYAEATTRERINDSPNNIDTKKPKENIHSIQASFKNCEEAHLTMEYPLEKEDKAVEQSKTRETICAIGIPEEIKEDEGDMNNGCDITVEDVDKLRKLLTPSIHALPIVQPYMPLGLTVHITPPDDDYVASATNPILNKHLNEFGEEFADNTRVFEKIDSNPVNDLKELLKTCSLYKEMEFEVHLTRVRVVVRGMWDRRENEIVSFVVKWLVSHDAVFQRVFPITLNGVAKRWVYRLPLGTVDSWDILKKAFIQRYCPPSKTGKQLEEIRNFKQEGDETLYQAWER